MGAESVKIRGDGFPAPRDLDSLIAKGDTPRIVKALAVHKHDIVRDRDAGSLDLGWQRRLRAAAALAGADGENVDAALADALVDPRPEVRLAAAHALAQRQVLHAAPVVEALLGNAGQDGFEEAAVAVAKHAEADPDAASAYAHAYAGSQMSDDRVVAAAVVRRLLDACPGELRAEIAAAALARAALAPAAAVRERQLLAADPTYAVPAAVAALNSDREQLIAVRVLGDARSVDGVEPLIAALDRHDAELRAEACSALARIRHPMALEALLLAASDNDFAVRDAAINAVDTFGAAGTVWAMASATRGLLDHVRREQGGELTAQAEALTALAESTAPPGSIEHPI